MAAKKTATPFDVSAIANAAFAEASGAANSATAIRAALGASTVNMLCRDEPAKSAKDKLAKVRLEYLAGVMAFLLPSNAAQVDRIALTRKVIALPGATAKTLPKGATGRRTTQQETTYATARQRWSRALQLAGIGPSDKRGGKRGAKKTPPVAAKTDKETVAKPDTADIRKGAKAMTRDEALAYLVQQAATMLQFADAYNAAHKGATLPNQATAAISDFKTAVTVLA